ncbi:glycine betaine ABC transporter substrate-binding protein [Pseudomonas sp. BMW13]|uniref:glycine betaine ABC transporter substrate-binding protein n=1 Tax=Pseudomonas sp. BMW13 TaxID=2562590 RepID=UPI0015837ECB|nr:glycine betaine ABC transporter substrate-binding protein [Pseudomonas sp. BMW13]
MKPIIRLGYIDLSFHAASAALVQRVLERHGYEVQVSAAPHEDMFRRFGAGAVDMLVSAWLPASHGDYLAPYAAQTRTLGVLYRPYCIWGVPDYVPVDAVQSVADLLRPEVATRMTRLIQGINPGAGISRFSRAIIQQYGLDRLGYHFENGTQADCFARYEQAHARREWCVVPLWHPQFLHHSHYIRPLDEPLGLLGGQDDATLIVSEPFARDMPAALLKELNCLSPGNAVISELDHMICRGGMSALQAADAWLARGAAL